MKSQHIVTATLCLALIGATGLANADNTSRQERLIQKLTERFTTADVNADGLLTAAEAEGKMHFVHRHFNEIDSGQQGAVSLDQIKDYVARKAMARGAVF